MNGSTHTTKTLNPESRIAMSKEAFDHSKLNFAASANLQKLGLSFLGAKQVLAAQIVTSKKDRDLLAKMIAVSQSADNKPVARYYLENAWPS